MMVHIRIAVAADRTPLEDLQLRASLNNEGDRAALLANPDAIELPAAQIDAGRVFVAEIGGTIVGFAALLPREDGQEELDGLFVDPDLWKRGIGRLLVERCVVFARDTGASALHVVGNPHAQGFYAACGFEQIGEHQTRFGRGLLMRKAL
ncbi:MAG TPA: GNAT family N-acetyltransferase [Vicinamibacterales bacterium]|jgi:GNAT superfamily N-acetyltransferase|nr:GNAT family N-acetyltransferase [Vicinamibacterales bacterium]